MDNNNQEQLDSFTKYCNKHTDLRFWQALRNWNKKSNPNENFILTAYDIDVTGDSYLDLEDTFYRT